MHVIAVSPFCCNSCLLKHIQCLLLISIGSAKTRIQLNLIQLSVLTLFLMLILVTHISVKIRLPFTQLYKEYKLRLENYSLSHRER